MKAGISLASFGFENIICFVLPSGVNAALVTAPVFKTGGTSLATFGGFDSHPLPLFYCFMKALDGSNLF